MKVLHAAALVVGLLVGTGLACELEPVIVPLP